MVSAVLLLLYLLMVSAMTLQSVFNLRMQFFIWGDPERDGFNRSPTEFAEPRLSFTVLLPARHEEAVIADTIEKVSHAHYPPELLQILVICESGDTGTIGCVRQKLAEPGTEQVELIIFDDGPINKPHGLNVGLRAATNDIVTIFDAEDEPHDDIFQIINTTFINEDVEVVQGGVHLMNYDTHWFSALNVLEYYFWFKSSLHYFGWSGMVPLGGNTVFVKRPMLQRLGGWDEHCLTEDADIGIRLSVAGARIRVLCDDEHVTREETPDSVTSLVRQRTRWSQGFFQVFRKGDWRHLPTASQRVLASYVLLVPFIQGIFALMLPISLLMMILVKLPVFIAMSTFLPLYIFGLQAIIDLVALVEFIHAQKREFSLPVLLLTVIGFFPYQWLLAFAAARAIVREIQHHTNWEKTAHAGAHRRDISGRMQEVA